MQNKNMQVTGKAVLEILSENDVFMGQMPAMLAAQTEFVLDIVKILGSKRLSAKVSFASVMEANIHFHKYGLDHGMADLVASEIKKAQDAMPKMAKGMRDDIANEMGELGDLFGSLFSDELVESLASMVANVQSQLTEAISQYEVVLQDPDQFLKDQGATELQGLIWIGLTPSLAARILDQKNLTISDLLLEEPGAIVNYPGSAAQATRRSKRRSKR